MDKYSPELDSTNIKSNHSQVLYRTIAPQGSNSVTTSITSTVGPTEFIIPPACFRLDKSRLNFSLLLAAPAAKCNFINGNLLTAISRVTLYDSATNSLWADISNINQYASLVVPAATDFQDYATKCYISGAIPATVANSQLNTIEDISKSNISTVNDTGDNVDMGPQNPLFSRRQFYISAANTATALDVSIPLSAFKLSALSSSKLMFCPSNLVLQVYWNANNNYSFIATAVTDPVTGVAPVESAIALSNISLTLANEGNMEIANALINKVMSGGGITLPIAYPTVTRQSISASSSHSYQLSLTRGYGNRILALITGFFSNAAGACYQNVHSRGTLTQYNTFLNNVAVKSQGGFNALASQDFIIGNREYLEGSVIQTIGEYLNGEWVHIDSYFGEKPLKDVDQHEIDGLDVSTQSSTWQVQATLSAATAYNWTTIIVGQKQLTITNQGSMVQ